MGRSKAIVHATARVSWCMLMLMLVLAQSAIAAEPKYPELTGRVVDQAAILSSATAAELTGMLARHEQATGEQVVVVTLDSLQGLPIEDFGYQLGRHWGIGQKGKNTGAILIVAPKERKVRIEVGYGLEGQLTDAISRSIIEGDIAPDFRRGNYNAGVIAGTTALLKVLGSDPSGKQPQAQGSGNQASGGMVMIGFVIWMIFMMLRNRVGQRAGIIRRIGGGPGGFYGGGGGGFGGGGGGFGGGGGSFGGGGASGSW